MKNTQKTITIFILSFILVICFESIALNAKQHKRTNYNNIVPVPTPRPSPCDLCTGGGPRPFPF